MSDRETENRRLRHEEPEDYEGIEDGDDGGRSSVPERKRHRDPEETEERRRGERRRHPRRRSRDRG